MATPSRTARPRVRRALRLLRRSVVFASAGVALVAVVVLVEVLIARRVERIEPWPRARLEGTFGVGDTEPLHLVWIGDSTGDGVGASSPETALPRLVAEGLSDARAGGGPARRVRLSVLARSGSRTSDALAEQVPELAGLEPDWVIVAIGNNDVVHVTSRARVERELTALLDGVAAAGPSRVAVLGIAEFAHTPLFAQPLRALAGWRADQIDAVVRRVAERHGTLYVDIMRTTGPAFAADPAGTHARDGFHPSDAGYRLWADATLDAIARARW